MSSTVLDTAVDPDADGLVGGVTAWPSNALPSAKYRFCDGSTVSRTEFSLLFSRLGTLHGVGDGSSTFALPNLVDKLVRGTDGSAGNEVGTTGGTSAASLPAHTHGHTLAVSAHTHQSFDIVPGGVLAAGTTYTWSYPQGGSTAPSISGSINSAGSGTGDNWPPFVRLRHIIKVS